MNAWESCRRYAKANEHVWATFEERALKLIALGRTQYSACTLINGIRWENDLKTQGQDGFKIKNEMGTFFGRVFVSRHPEHAAFFKLKPSAMDTDWAAWAERNGLNAPVPKEECNCDVCQCYGPGACADNPGDWDDQEI